MSSPPLSLSCNAICKKCRKEIAGDPHKIHKHVCAPCRRAYSGSFAKRRSPVARLLYSARKRSKVSGVEFSLRREDVIVPEFCPVLGLKLKVASGAMDPAMPSLDRFDNSKGYTADNVRVISWRANRIKGDATADELSRVANYCSGNG